MTILYSYPPQSLTISPSATKFLLDGVITDVSKDSAIPANTIALPVEDVNVLEAVNTLGLLVQNVDIGPGTSAGVPVLAHDPSVNEFKYLNVDTSNALKVSAVDLPLPSGAATELAQEDLFYKTPSAIVTVAHDEIVTTYVGATTDIATVVYKEIGGVVATLTFSYDGSNRLIGVVRS